MYVTEGCVSQGLTVISIAKVSFVEALSTFIFSILVNSKLLVLSDLFNFTLLFCRSH